MKISHHTLGMWSVVLLLSLTSLGDAMARKWTQIANEKGVRVTSREVAGRDLPVFRGVATFKHSVFDVLTVLDHIPSHTEWVHRCTESRVVKKITDFSRIIYNRTDAPWPVSDRDMVVRTNAAVDPEKSTVRISFRAIRGHVSKRDGVVRIERLLGFYFLEVLGDEKTRVTYQIDTDPGGWLPNWLIKLASKRLPLDTLVNLRKRLVKVRGRGGREEAKAVWLSRLKTETGQVLPSEQTQTVAPKEAAATLE